MLAIKLSQVYKWARGLTGNSSFWFQVDPESEPRRTSLTPCSVSTMFITS